MITTLRRTVSESDLTTCFIPARERVELKAGVPQLAIARGMATRAHAEVRALEKKVRELEAQLARCPRSKLIRVEEDK